MPRTSQNGGPIIPGSTKRPSPPPELIDPREIKVWRDIVRSLPADWFTSGSHLLLKALCQHIRLADDTMKDIKQARTEVDEVKAMSAPPPKLLIEALKKYRAALQSHLLQTGQIASLSTKLRLTPQSRYGHRSAKTAAETVSPYPELWNDWGLDSDESGGPDDGPDREN
jgi:hypothetical protein